MYVYHHYTSSSFLLFWLSDSVWTLVWLDVLLPRIAQRKRPQSRLARSTHCEADCLRERKSRKNSFAAHTLTLANSSHTHARMNGMCALVSWIHPGIHALAWVEYFWQCAMYYVGMNGMMHDISLLHCRDSARNGKRVQQLYVLPPLVIVHTCSG